MKQNEFLHFCCLFDAEDLVFQRCESEETVVGLAANRRITCLIKLVMARGNRQCDTFDV